MVNTHFLKAPDHSLATWDIQGAEEEHLDITGERQIVTMRRTVIADRDEMGIDTDLDQHITAATRRYDEQVVEAVSG